MDTPETQKSKLRILHFSPEGYVSDTSQEYYEQFANTLRSHGFDPLQLLYSGTDAALVLDEQGSPKPSSLGIFAMNEAGWLEAIRQHDMTPASYADKEGLEQPCVLLYPRSQLAEVYSHTVDLDEQDYSAPVSPSDIVPGENLQDVPLDKIVCELVIHKDFPNALPSDTMLGLVYLDEARYDDSKQTGL